MQTERGIRRLGSMRSDARRVRDLVRSRIHHGEYPNGQLPGEAELMVAHGASRGVVREALSLLRAEGVIDRVQGIGTFVVSVPSQHRLVEIHGLAHQPEALDFPPIHPEVLDREVVPTPEAVAARLGDDATPTCARIEYLAVMGAEPVGIATNYVVFPEAELLLAAPFESHWYAYLGAAGLTIGDTEFLIGALPADGPLAGLMRVREGAPLFYLEQVIEDPAGRKFNFALIHFRADWLMIRSRASWQAALGGDGRPAV